MTWLESWFTIYQVSTLCGWMGVDVVVKSSHLDASEVTQLIEIGMVGRRNAPVGGDR